MKLYVDTMDAIVVDVVPDGRIRLENEDWSEPTLQERRAILYSAQNEVAELTELLEILSAQPGPGLHLARELTRAILLPVPYPLGIEGASAWLQTTRIPR